MGPRRGAFSSAIDDFLADVIRPPENMHIKVADARRRFGETSWEAYRQEAAHATGGWWKLMGRGFGRRDDDYRLEKLGGTWLGDVRQWIMPRGLEKLEMEIWAWRSQLITVEEFTAKLRRICREDAWPIGIGVPTPNYQDERESFEKHSTARRDRLALYESKGIDGLLSGYPYIELWLEKLRQQKRSSREPSRVVEDVLEEVGEAAFTEFWP